MTGIKLVTAGWLVDLHTLLPSAFMWQNNYSHVPCSQATVVVIKGERIIIIINHRLHLVKLELYTHTRTLHGDNTVHVHNSIRSVIVPFSLVSFHFLLCYSNDSFVLLRSKITVIPYLISMAFYTSDNVVHKENNNNFFPVLHTCAHSISCNIISLSIMNIITIIVITLNP